MPFPPGQVVKFTNIFNLAMTEDRKTVSITAINPLGLRSDDLLANLTVFVDKPIKSGELPYDKPSTHWDWGVMTYWQTLLCLLINQSSQVSYHTASITRIVSKPIK